MFHLNDFNVVCCALATLSAAAGYHVAKRGRTAGLRWTSSTDPLFRRFRRGSTSSTFSACESAADSEITEFPGSTCSRLTEKHVDQTVPGTLKRKGREEDLESETDGLNGVQSAPPKKRCRTPPLDDSDLVPKAEIGFPATPLPDPETQASRPEFPDSERSVGTEASKEPSLVISSPPTVSETPIFPSAFSIPAAKSSSAFVAFTGSTSPFLVASSPSSRSTRPVWCSPAIVTASAADRSGVAEMKPEVIELTSDTHEDEAARSSSAAQTADALAAHSYAKGADNVATGEEEERVVTELKGAKVFIKRGDKEFSDGILGHVKLLSHGVTEEERILFRREPVWKISMSVRLRSTVRCTFDEAQSTLRVTLKEVQEQDGVPRELWPQRMVIYALKRGKATKSDFEQFARRVVTSSRLSITPMLDLASTT
ncbi:hypothetical protein CERSUDRAFT_112680 [Gelatoporia subvermispora B]|uniref:RanBD1 domain-containing protein n=1 Tax=Ceriporiopsis subvermispora (strain B) TaxID=914234 RepID=M2R368_CERS8|nr:hypothetical protein CERSUDRAFT_112680 [Gelatoporia subvermispora B]